MAHTATPGEGTVCAKCGTWSVYIGEVDELEDITSLPIPTVDWNGGTWVTPDCAHCRA